MKVWILDQDSAANPLTPGLWNAQGLELVEKPILAPECDCLGYNLEQTWGKVEELCATCAELHLKQGEGSQSVAHASP